MKSKGNELGDTREGEDECGVSSSVESRPTHSKWLSMPQQDKQHTQYATHTHMLYVNLEESPTYLERDPNMSCTARYSPTTYHPPTHTPNMLDHHQPTYQKQQEETTAQNYLQYNPLNTDRLAPLLQVLESPSPYFPTTVPDTFEVTSSNATSTTMSHQTTTSHLYMPIAQQPSPSSTSQSSLAHSQMDTTDLQFILTSDCEYQMMEGGKGDQVELFIARDPSGTSYSVTNENGFLIARPTMPSTMCSPIKPESMVSEVNSIPVDVSILDTLDEATQFDKEHDIVMEADTLTHFTHTDDMVMQSTSEGSVSPSHLEEVECGEMVNLEEIAQYLDTQEEGEEEVDHTDTAHHTEKTRPSRRRQQQLDNTIMCIPDKSVPCRARASLPGTHLSFKAGHVGSVKGVYAKRRIPVRARFGPLEGSKRRLPKGCTLPTPATTDQPLFLVHTPVADYVFDVSDERTSNWMRYVRFEAGPQQNVCLQQIDGELFFITCRPIAPKQELLLGYSAQYAKQWNLPPPPQFVLESDETAMGWPCYECSLGFPTSSELQAHLNTHDEEDKSSGSYSRKPKRKVSKSSNSGALHSCDVCSKTFSSIFSLKRHMAVHEDNKSMDNQCYTKDQQIPNNDISQSEMKRESYHAKDYKVDLFSSQAQSKRDHYVEREQLVPDSQMDNDSYDSSCTDMNPDQESYEGLQKDMASLDANVELFLCSLCNKFMHSALQLELHSKEHESGIIKPVPCPSCPTENLNNPPSIKVEDKTSQVGSEVDVTSGKKTNANAIGSNNVENTDSKVVKQEGSESKLGFIMCPVCPRSFKNGSQLKDHVQKLHMRSDGKYDCPLCIVILADYRSLKKHIRVYHAVKKISCPECGNNFATNDKLRLHMLKHSDRRDFVCNECGKQFKRRDKLKEHTKKIHSGDAKPVKVKEPPLGSPVDPTAYLQFTFKCHPCRRGFKRRGMLVNHLAKRHPEVVRATVPELQLPILRVARNYYCQHCDKVYKSSSKRKAHIIKNHPGEAIPPSSRGKGVGTTSLEIKEGYSKYVGSVPTVPHACPHQPCHKQYASKAKLLQHIRLKHSHQFIHQVADSKENSMNKTKDCNSPMSKSEVSSSTSSVHDSEQRHVANAIKMKVSQSLYQDYDSVSEKMVSPNILTKSKPSDMPVSNGKWEGNKILSNLLNNGQPSQGEKPLTEIKLGGYLTGSSGRQTSLPTKSLFRNNLVDPSALVRNTGTRLRIIQLSDGTQIIEESDVPMELQKKAVYGKVVGDSIQRTNISGQMIMDNDRLPPVSVLAGNTNKDRYTDR